jgi:hypothetical protein
VPAVPAVAWDALSLLRTSGNISHHKDSETGVLKTLVSTTALLGGLALAPAAQAQISVNIGVQPVCSYGYYGYQPYACAPMGYYGSGYFYNGIFVGMGPWAGWGYGHGWGSHRFHGDGGGNYHGGVSSVAYNGHSGGPQESRGSEAHTKGGSNAGEPRSSAAHHDSPNSAPNSGSANHESPHAGGPRPSAPHAEPHGSAPHASAHASAPHGSAPHGSGGQTHDNDHK